MKKIRKLNIPKAFDRISEFWSPHIAAQVNGQEVRLAKINGEFDWHSHDGVDEAFFVIRGSFVLHFRSNYVPMHEGDLLVVPAGIEHKPQADEECWILLIENARYNKHWGQCQRKNQNKSSVSIKSASAIRVLLNF